MHTTMSRHARSVGTLEKTRKNTQKLYDYDTCPHEITDKRGSSKNMSRIYCLQCQEFISEMPQEHRRDREKLGQSIARSSDDALEVATNLTCRQESVRLFKGEVLACLDELSRQVQADDKDQYPDRCRQMTRSWSRGCKM